MMTEEEKKTLLAKFKSLNTTSDANAIRHLIDTTDFSKFVPDFNNDLDKSLVNMIFTRIILAVIGSSDLKSVDTLTIFGLSILKHILNKMTKKVEHFLIVEVVPHVINGALTIRVKVHDKVRHYTFKHESFKELNQQSFDAWMTQYTPAENAEYITLLPLTEMETTTNEVHS